MELRLSRASPEIQEALGLPNLEGRNKSSIFGGYQKEQMQGDCELQREHIDCQSNR